MKKIIYSSEPTDNAEDNKFWYSDECANLDRHLDGRILVVASLGLWNGRKSGYKILGHNLNRILSAVSDGELEVYFDGHNVLANNTHHDGTNHLEFREIREDTNIDKLLDMIYEDNFTRKDLNRYTKSLGGYVRKIYGW